MVRRALSARARVCARVPQERRTEYWQSLRRSMRECSANHEAFFKSLEHSTDGFSTVVEHFGRSIIS